MRSLFIAATLLGPAAAHAGGYVIPNETARDLALSQAAVADQTGAEAVFLNTAALAGPEGINISASGEILVNRTDWSDPNLGKASMDAQVNTPPAIAISYGSKLPDGMAWGAAVGMHVPAGGSLEWPDGWQGQESIKSVKQLVFAFGGGAAFQPSPYIKVGVNYVRFQATEELHQAINYLDHYGDAGIAMSGGANGFGAGLELRVPNVPLSFGAMYSHSADLHIKGDAHFTDVPVPFQPLLHDQGVKEVLPIPAVFFVGAAYSVMPNLKIMAAYNFEGWSSYKSDKFEGADGFTVEVPRDYNNAHVIRAAGEWKEVAPGLTLRLGGLRSISDQPRETLSPSLTDASSTAFSLGAGYNIMPQLRIDLGWQHAFFDKVTAKGDEAFPGSYKTMVDLVSLGVNWRIGV